MCAKHTHALCMHMLSTRVHGACVYSLFRGFAPVFWAGISVHWAYACTVDANTEHMHALYMQILNIFMHCAWICSGILGIAPILWVLTHENPKFLFCLFEKTLSILVHVHHARTRTLSIRMQGVCVRSFYACMMHADAQCMHENPYIFEIFWDDTQHMRALCTRKLRVHMLCACVRIISACMLHAMLSVHIFFKELNNKLKKNNMTKSFWSLNLPSRWHWMAN